MPQKYAKANAISLPSKSLSQNPQERARSFLHAVGIHPNSSLKYCVKYFGLLKPTVYATSATVN
jgi:hypothetical protein